MSDELEQLRRRVKRAEHRAELTHRFWLRAARKALNGDMKELRERVALADEPPVEVVLSPARQ